MKWVKLKKILLVFVFLNLVSCSFLDQGDESGTMSSCVEADSETQYHFRAGCEGVLIRGTSFGWAKYNKMGLRDRDYGRKKAGRKRILFLGNSKLVGPGLKDDQPFIRILEKRAQGVGIDVELVNGGIEGVHPGQIYLFAKRFDREYEPDRVVYWVDLSSSAHKTTLLNSFAKRAADGSILRYEADLAGAAARFFRSEWLGNWVSRNYVSVFSLYLGIERARFSWRCFPKRKNERELALCLVGDALDAIVHTKVYFEKKGVPFTLVTNNDDLLNIVHFSPGTPKWLQKVMGLFAVRYQTPTAVVVRILEEKGVRVILLPTPSSWGPGYRVGDQDNHLNGRGQQRQADEFWPAFQSLLR